MADWISQYSAALDARDAREKAHKTYIDAYTKLADRAASAETATQAPSDQIPIIAEPVRPGTPTRGVPLPPPSPSQAATPDLLARLRADLAATQRSRADLQAQLSRLQSELSTSLASAKATARRTEELERDKRDLERKVSDRDAELREKRMLVNAVQDEMLAMTMQLNITEEKDERLRVENEMLVKRWMDKMGEEAEKMNSQSRWT